MDGMTINLKGTFGYETKQEQAKNDKGELLFSIGEKEIAAKEVNGKLVFINEKNNQEIFGTLGDDGKVSFQDGSGTTVYARMDTNGKLTFTTDESKKADVSAVINETLVKDTKAEGVTFETSSDADKIVDAVKQMVEDYNAMAKEIKDAYSTLPAQRSNGAYYEPLTSEEEEDASESFIKNWNEKAKQGILFGDRDLASLYQRMTSAISTDKIGRASCRERV